MPSLQRGQVFKQKTGWACRWYDPSGDRKQQGRFKTRAEAVAYLDARLAEVRNGPTPRLLTVSELADEFLDQHVAETNSLRTLDHQLRKLTSDLGDRRVDLLTVAELRSWRKRLPKRSAWNLTKAMRQVLNYAVLVGYVPENVGKKVLNPEPKRPEIRIFTPDELEAISAELGSTLPQVVAGIGLRPQEWVALERRDIERGDRPLVNVRRVYVDGRIREYGKTRNSVPRQVPLTPQVVAALDALTPRLDTPLQFPGVRGGHLNYPEWRRDAWTPALRAAGLEYRTPYALRHTYASNALAATVNAFDLAQFMGTSLQQINSTYGHLLPDAIDRARAALTAFEEATG